MSGAGDSESCWFESPQLVILRGGLRAEVHEVEEGPLFIGRDAGCTIVLDDPLVSRRHARIARDAGGWAIEDLGSRNGIRIDEQPVRSARLQHGTKIDIGSHHLIFRDPDGASDGGEAAGEMTRRIAPADFQALLNSVTATQPALETPPASAAADTCSLRVPATLPAASAPEEGNGSQLVLVREDDGTRFLFAKAEIRVGRDEGADLRLDDESISRDHAAIIRGPFGFEIQDLGSVNGTLLEGSPIARSPLRTGQRLRLGEVSLRVERAPAPALVPVAPPALAPVDGDPRRRWWLAVASAAAVLCAGVAGGGLLWVSHPSRDAGRNVPVPATPAAAVAEQPRDEIGRRPASPLTAPRHAGPPLAAAETAGARDREPARPDSWPGAAETTADVSADSVLLAYQDDSLAAALELARRPGSSGTGEGHSGARVAATLEQIRSLLEAADVAASNGKYDDAVSLWNMALVAEAGGIPTAHRRLVERLERPMFEAELQRAREAQAHGKLQLARQYLQAATRINPEDPDLEALRSELGPASP